METVEQAMEEHRVFLEQQKKDREAFLKKVFALETQISSAYTILAGLEALSKEISAWLETVRPLAERHFVKMSNKKVWFDRENGALFPMFEAVELPVVDTSTQPAKSFRGFDFEGFHFMPMTQEEFRKSFASGSGNPYLRKDGGYEHFPSDTYSTVILTKEVQGADSHWCWVNGNDGWYRSGRKVTLVPICRLHRENSPGLDAMEAIRTWLSNDLIPDDMDSKQRKGYGDLLKLWKNSYLVFEKTGAEVKKKTLLRDVLLGKFKETVFGYRLDFGVATAKYRPKPLTIERREKPKKPPVQEVPEERKGGQNMEEIRVPLTSELLKGNTYPKEVYYDGGALVDTFISTTGNYVQGYVTAGMYRVANINAAKRTVLLYHTPEARNVFRRNPVFHSAFETFTVPFQRVFVPKAPPKGTSQKAQGEAAPSPEVEMGTLMEELKAENEALSKRLSALEQQMKALQTIRDPVSKQPPRRQVAPQEEDPLQGQAWRPGAGPYPSRMRQRPPFPFSSRDSAPPQNMHSSRPGPRNGNPGK